MTPVAISFKEVVLNAIVVLSIGAIGVAAFVMIRSIRRETALRPAGPAVGALVSVLVLWAYVGLLHVEVRSALSWLLLFAGLVTGALWSRTTALTVRGGVVFGRRSPWYVVVWAATLALSQLLALFASREAAAYGLSTVFFSTGLSLGLNVALIARWSAARNAPLAPYAPLAPHTRACLRCGTPTGDPERFCRTCGAPLQA